MELELRVWLMGTECELRPISAKTRLESRKKAGELFLQLGGDAQSDRLIEAAALISAGLYDGDRPVFASPEEALESLSADEILELAADYGELWGLEPADEPRKLFESYIDSGRIYEDFDNYMLSRALEKSAVSGDELRALLPDSEGDGADVDLGPGDRT
ncbi:MAG: hypothetical protein IJG63_08300, partial [Oscillospiraceae bacterium]|nr:hypothetical protein [Oscillospiraceae bacterium]